MTASKGPTVLIAKLRKAAARKGSNDPRGCIFTDAANCLEAQAQKIRRMKEELDKANKKPPHTTQPTEPQG